MLGVKVYGSLVTAYRSLTHLPWRPAKIIFVGINLLSGESLVQSSLPCVKTADNGFTATVRMAIRRVSIAI